MKPSFRSSFNGYNREEVDAWCEGFNEDYAKLERIVDSQAAGLRKLAEERDAARAEMEKSVKREQLVSLKLPPAEVLNAFGERQKIVMENAQKQAVQIVDRAKQHAVDVSNDANTIIDDATRQAEDIVAEAKAKAAEIMQEVEKERSEWVKERSEEKASIRRFAAETKSACEEIASETERKCKERVEDTEKTIARLEAEAAAHREQVQSDFNIAQKERREKVDRDISRLLSEANNNAQKMKRDALEYVDRIEKSLTPKVQSAIDNAMMALNSAQMYVSDLPSTKTAYNQELTPAEDTEQDGEGAMDEDMTGDESVQTE